MNDAGIRRTNQAMRALDKRLQAIYRDAYETAIANEKRWIEKLASLPPDTPKAKRLAFYREVKRQSGMVDRIAAEIASAGGNAAKEIQLTMVDVFGINFDYATWSIQDQIGHELNFTIYDKNQIRAIIESQRSPFSKIAYNNLGEDKRVVRKLGNALASATMNGESQQKIMKRIRDVTGQNVWQSRRVAQTERTRVQSQSRFMGIQEAAEMGIDIGKRWTTRMINSRDAHIAVNGEERQADEDFSNGLAYPGDPRGRASDVINCRCVLQPIVR